MPQNFTQIFASQQVLLDQLIKLLPALIGAVIIFFIYFYVARFARSGLRQIMVRRNDDPNVIRLLSQIAYLTIIFFGLVAAFQNVGVNMTAVLAGLGILGFTVGFALQDVSKNFVAGMLLLLQKPFHVGEFIEVSGFQGTVTVIDLRTTEIRTSDGRMVLIPNADVFTNAIINYTRVERRRLDLQLSVGYESDLETARRAALQALAGVPGILPEPAPQVIFQSFGASAIAMGVFFWVDPKQVSLEATKDAALGAVKSRLEEAKFNLAALPQMLLVQS